LTQDREQRQTKQKQTLKTMNMNNTDPTQKTWVNQEALEEEAVPVSYKPRINCHMRNGYLEPPTRS